MGEPIDVYSDQFMVTTTSWGANLSFLINTPHPDPTKVTPPERLATIRMSNEHLKVMAMIIVRQLKNIETQEQDQYPIIVKELRSRQQELKKLLQICFRL